MKPIAFLKSSALALLAFCAVSQTASAVTLPVTYNYLVSSATVGTPFHADDTLFVDTLVTTEVGALLQTTTFTTASDVAGVTLHAAWEVAGPPAPQLGGVNIDVFDASNTLVFSDTFAGVLAAFAHSGFQGPIGPGTYHMVATGTGVTASSLDISLTFSAVPEPGTLALMVSGLGLLGIKARRRS